MNFENEEDKRPFIKMLALVKVQLKEEEGLDFGKTTFSVGGYSFICKNSNDEDASLLFDFDAFTITPREGDMLEIIRGKGMLFNEYHISDIYKDILSDSEFSINNVTANILANTSRIDEFFFEVGDTKIVEYFELKEVVFVDEIGFKHEVSNTVLDEFNANWKDRI